MTVARHFTVSGFVVHAGRVLLHWHPKVRAWLPPGGHVDANEDPTEAVVREVQEETGLQVEVVQTGARLELDYPTQVQPPFTIMIEDIHDPDEGYHQHIDMIYFCRIEGPTPLNRGWLWVGRADLADGTTLHGDGATSASPPDDVRLLGLEAIAAVDRG